jgi:hypothetical protein
VIPNATAAAISLEEVIPSTVSDAKIAVAKEVYAGQVRKSQEELDSKEKNKLRQKAKRKIRAEKKYKDALKDKSRVTEGQVTKNMAMKKLIGQKNVTLVVDPKQKQSKGNAKTVAFGGKVGEGQSNIRAEMLKL